MCITVAIKPHKTARLKFQQQHFRDLKGRMRIATCPSIPKLLPQTSVVLWMFFLAQFVRYRYTAIESCIPAVRGLEFA